MMVLMKSRNLRELKRRRTSEKNNLFTIDLCQKEGEEGMEKFMKASDTWSRNEYSHAYTNSPKTSDKRETAICPN